MAASTATVTVMPGFTLGALAPWIETDLHVSRSAVGLAMSAFYVATALGSPVTKRLAARLQVGVYTGATIAPFTFGTLSSSFGFAGTALMAAAAALAAAVSMTIGTRVLHLWVAGGSNPEPTD